MADALKRPEWIERAALEIDGLTELGEGIDRDDLEDVIERCWDAHLAALPVAEPCDHGQLLRDCRQLIDSYREMRRPNCPDDAREAQECLDRIDAALGE